MIKGTNGAPDILMTLIVVVSCDLCAQKNTYGADQADLASSEMAMHIISAHPSTAAALALGLGL